VLHTVNEMRVFTRTRIAMLALVLGAPSCTDAGLLPIPEPRPIRDDKLALAGTFCTTNPDSRVFPLRVLFVVDSSESMAVTDPPDPLSGETGRERAVRETWERLLDGGPEGVRVGILRFSAEAASTTPVDSDGDSIPDLYYTSDRTLLGAGTLRLRTTDRTTNYLNALSEAYYEMRTELLGATLESLPLSRYVVVFVSDGLPDVDSMTERENSEENILDAVRQLVDLAHNFRVGRFELHTAYLSAGEGPARDRPAQDLLKKMSEVGGGTFRSFPSGESLNFLFVNLTIIRRVFTLQGLSVVNLNAITDEDQIINYLLPGGMGMPGADGGMMADAGMLVDAGPPMPDGGLPGTDAGVPLADAGPAVMPIDPRLFVDLDGNGSPACGEALVDTDGDGLADFVEAIIGTNILVIDTDNDGLNDRLESRLTGLDPLDPTDARCFIPSACGDRDMDGYCDCLVDLDLDGMCDCVADPDEQCADPLGHDCVDADMDRLCDCPDLNGDGLCEYPDRDGDGLTDCEEVFFGTAQHGNDTDADGLPDWLEVRAEVNPTEDDRLLDADLDRSNNGGEVLANTDAWCDESSVRSLTSARYSLDTLGLSDGRSCYSFDVNNITLVPTAPNPAARYPGNGWNRILLFAGEVSFDDPDAFAQYRIACVMVGYEPDGNYKNPPSGRVVLTADDFVDAGDFNADMHCIWP